MLRPEPKRGLKLFRSFLMQSTCKAIMDYAELKAQIVLMERIKDGEYTMEKGLT